jgi:hypothetical protein
VEFTLLGYENPLSNSFSNGIKIPFNLELNNRPCNPQTNSMKFLSLSKVKKHPLYFSHSWYVIPPHQLGTKGRNILYIKFIP